MPQRVAPSKVTTTNDHLNHEDFALDIMGIPFLERRPAASLELDWFHWVQKFLPVSVTRVGGSVSNGPEKLGLGRTPRAASRCTDPNQFYREFSKMQIGRWLSRAQMNNEATRCWELRRCSSPDFAWVMRRKRRHSRPRFVIP
jgi:hypothetical protein